MAVGNTRRLWGGIRDWLVSGTCPECRLVVEMLFDGRTLPEQNRFPALTEVRDCDYLEWRAGGLL